jgi:formamidopyrimidine-DNA glycosylase
MPELPDLEVFSANLNKKIKGKTLTQVSFGKRINSNVSTGALKKAITGMRLTKVQRFGKELYFIFSQKQVLGIHLMLHGYLYWVDEEPKKHTLATFTFSNKIQLGLSDFQYQARLTLNPKEPDAPDALSKKVNATFWKEALQSKAAIKKLLLNQQVVRGIGNAYADEILWKARISPFSISSKIPAAHIRLLDGSIKQVLKDAQKNIRKKEPGIIGGEVRDFLAVHNSQKKKSPGGAAIKKQMVGGRKTYYTSEQKLFK